MRELHHDLPETLDHWLSLLPPTTRPLTVILLYHVNPPPKPQNEINQKHSVERSQNLLKLKMVLRAHASGPLQQKHVAAHFPGEPPLRIASREFHQGFFGSLVVPTPLRALKVLNSQESCSIPADLVATLQEIDAGTLQVNDEGRISVEMVVVVEQALVEQAEADVERDLCLYLGEETSLRLSSGELLAELRGCESRSCQIMVLPLAKREQPGPKPHAHEDPTRKKPQTHKFKDNPCFRHFENAGPGSNPFAHLKLSSQRALHDAVAAERAECQRCRKTGKFYCTTCLQLLPPIVSQSVPQVRLPLAVDVIKHERELNGKTTAFHAKILARDAVQIIDFPLKAGETLGYSPEETVVLFPGPAAVPVRAFPQWQQIKRVVALDATWTTVSVILDHPVIKALPQVSLSPQETHFWRHAKASTHLSTIEALWHFFQDYTEARGAEGPADPHSYDDLLYFFTFFHQLVGEKMLEHDQQHTAEGQGQQSR